MTTTNPVRKSVKIPKKGPTVPLGTLVVNDKWNDTPLGIDLKRVMQVYFVDGQELGIVDFFLTQLIPVVYIPQSELMVEVNSIKTKLKTLQDEYSTGAIIIAVRNKATILCYNDMVEFASMGLQLDVDVIPIGNQTELPQLLKGLTSVETTSPSNPYKQKIKVDQANVQLQMLNQIPGIGGKKCKLLLEKFGHIEGVANASTLELKDLIGNATAHSVWDFFHGKICVPVIK